MTASRTSRGTDCAEGRERKLPQEGRQQRLTRITRCEQTIRKSRFIGVCGPVASEAEANEFIATHGEPGCRHVCFAWRIGELLRFSDAGEPGGTAGRPILAAIEHHNLDRAVVVVSRFFGGIKLGTGGLARAYGGTAMEVLAKAPMQAIVQITTLACNVPFDSAGDLHQLMERHKAEKLGEKWTGNGLQLEIEITRESADTFINELTAITHGACSVQRTK
ncbi:MAG: IMPACT family protein [Wenzhouxiangellaceae bacterium]